MRPTRRAALAAAALGLILGSFALSSPAGAAGESEELCMVEAVHKAEEGLAEGEELSEAALENLEAAIKACKQAPNPILPETNEIIWGGFGFLVVFGLLGWKGVPAIKKTMDERTEKIRSDLESAEASKVEAASTLAGYQAQLSEAKAESARILEEARQEADRVRTERIAAIDPELAEIRQRAEADAETIRTQALADLRAEVTSLALGAAERVVERNLDDATNRALIDAYIDSVGAARS